MSAPMPMLRRLDRALTWLALGVGGATLAFMTVLSTVNVLVMRKALNDPIRGGEDLMVLALVVVVAVSIPYGARTGAHIEIELLDEHLPARLRAVTLPLVKVLAIAIVSLLSWQLWLAGGSASRFGEASRELVISFGPFYRILAAAAAVYVFVLVLELIAMLRGQPLARIELERADTPGGDQRGRTGSAP